jgi:hypothetical protein
MEPKIGKSYFIEPDGTLHEVENCKHHEFALKYIEKFHGDLLESFPRRNVILTTSEKIDTCKDLMVGHLGWITFTPLGDNTCVGDVGRDKDGEPRQIRFSKKQIHMLFKLWEVNRINLGRLERIISENERHGMFKT